MRHAYVPNGAAPGGAGSSNLKILNLLIALLVFFAMPAIVHAGEPPMSVYYIGPSGAVERALELAPSLELTESVGGAQVVVLNGSRLNGAPVAQIADAVRDGAGLLLIAGPELSDSKLATLLGQPVETQMRDDAQTLQAVAPTGPSWLDRLRRQDDPELRRGAGLEQPVDPVLRQVNWRSAPQIRERFTIDHAGLQVLVQTYQTDEPVLVRATLGRGTVYLLTPWVSAEANPQLQEWPYFNYLIYNLVTRATGQPPADFADYAAAPVPHAGDRLVLLGLVSLMLGTTVALFLSVRRYSLKHPEALDHLVASVPDQPRAEDTTWEDVGFHRPLAGFLVLLAMGLVLFIPFMIYSTVLLPRFLLPSAQALGAWSLIINFFNTFWILFDMGTSVAFVKYFSELRVDQPHEGLKFIQLYIWWQAITGTIQLGLVAVLAAYVVPQTAYAYLTWFIVLHALIQFPGFLRMFQYVFRAFQRLDYDQILNILAQPAPGGTGPGSIGLILIVLQALAVLAARRLFAGNPIFGSALGGGFGLGIGLYLTELSIFAVGLLLYRRLGYHLRVLFMAHFDRRTISRALRFGSMITLGGVLGAIGWSVQVLLMERYLLNYTEIQGNWNVAFGLIVAFSAVAALYQGLMPGISEAYSHGREALTRYYVAQGFKYGGWFSGFIAGALLAVADRFILGSLGDEWVRAAQIVGILIIWGTFQFPAWFSDQFQQGVGKPWLSALMLFIEQALRVVLMLALLQRFQLWGLILAYLIALPTKDVLAWLVNARLILRPSIYWWQTVAAPVLAAAVNYVTLRSIGLVIWREDLPTSLLLFFIAILPSLPWYCFWNGVFGGWDSRGLAVLRRAVRISSIARPIAVLVYQASALGARVSPLHGRFPITLYAEAHREARELTREKVPLGGEKEVRRGVPAAMGGA
ncbi:MAG: lipopolysaccharide biosynthesis protein [Anaerolineae bacterium]